MNRRAAGKAFEKKCKEFLQSIGWTVDQARSQLHWIGPGKCVSGPCDFFSAADLIAINPNRSYTLFVQCTVHDDLKVHKKKIEAIPWNLSVQRVEIWTGCRPMRHKMRTLTLVGENEWLENFWFMTNGKEPEYA